MIKEKTTEPAKDYMQFDKYIIETRNEFVRKFWDMYPNSEKRVVAEDLLICFDQMRERLYQYSQPASQPEPAKESQTDSVDDKTFKEASAASYFAVNHCTDERTCDAFIEGYIQGKASQPELSKESQPTK